MENGKTKSTLRKHIGQSKMVIWMATRENIYTWISKNGKTNQVGGAVLL